MPETIPFNDLPQVNKDDPTPRHLQVQRILRDLVLRNVLRPGDKIPAELEIASALGVSKMTVNKALLALTAEGYFIREVGRGTFVAPLPSAAKPAAPRRIVLSFTEGAQNILESDYYGTLYRGIVEYLAEHNLDLSLEIALTPLNVDPLTYSVPGRLMVAPRRSAVPVLRQWWEQGRMLVVIGANWPDLPVPTIDSDNVGGAEAAVRHLTDQGHQRIALLYGEEETTNIQDRILGYHRALTAAGLSLDPASEVRAEGSWNIGEPARRQLRSLLLAPEPITAVFAAGYHLALEAKHIIRTVGRRIPEEISVVGYDDPVAARLIHPALTTVRQPLYEMGRRAAERLLGLIGGTEAPTPTREILPAELVIRDSTAEAPNRRRHETGNNANKRAF
ncbi:MAG: GntR family transcriptional regulator [Capsulimonadales bacterium]|nr:GntR family transcriptional regulator [Capsulimonadales bacterium]